MVFGKKQKEPMTQPPMVIDPNQQQVAQASQEQAIPQQFEQFPQQKEQPSKQVPKALITAGNLLEDGNYRYVVETNYPMALGDCVIRNEY